jgi:IS4 transposase
MKLEAITASQLLEMIPESLYRDLTDELAVDKWVPKMKATYLFKLLVFSILQTEDLSLRVIEEFSRTPVLLGLAPDLFEPVSYGTIRARLINVKVEFFERLYKEIYQRLADKFVVKSKSKYRLKRYDSTMVATFAHLLDAMKVGNCSKNKRQVKFTTELTDQFLVKVAFFKDQSYLSEHTALKEVIENSTHLDNEVVVFDLGLSCRKSLQGFSDKNTKFVTRGKHNVRYKPLQVLTAAEKLPETDQLEFLEDVLCHLFASGKEEIRHPFRLIKARRKTDGKQLCFITNILELPAAEIAELYRQRWEIEVFFKFLKQEMNLTHFLCHDENAIKVMIYCTLIASMLVLAYKHSNQIKSFKIAKIRFFKELHLDIIEELVDHPNGIVWVKDLIKLNKIHRK